MNRPWPAAITVLTKYLPAPLEEASLQRDDRLSLFLHDFWDEGSQHFKLIQVLWSPHRVVDGVQAKVRAVVLAFSKHDRWFLVS